VVSATCSPPMSEGKFNNFIHMRSNKSPLEDSLFSDRDEDDSECDTPLQNHPAVRDTKDVPGLHQNSHMSISSDISKHLLQCIEEGNYFSGKNQVMLFGRTRILPDGSISTGLPSFLNDLIVYLSGICKPYIPSNVWSLLFPDASSILGSRQVILNRYEPGQGISPHVDLLQRYGDGIIGVSLGSGCAMDFRYVGSPSLDTKEKEVALWLPENSIIVLEGDARYKWSHGIRPLHGDVVKNFDTNHSQWVPRTVRTSITIRWLLPGADVVGPVTLE
jgi:hypothetical protein